MLSDSCALGLNISSHYQSICLRDNKFVMLQNDLKTSESFAKHQRQQIKTAAELVATQIKWLSQSLTLCDPSCLDLY